MRCWQTVLLKPQLRADIRDCRLSTEQVGIENTAELIHFAIKHGLVP